MPSRCARHERPFGHAPRSAMNSVPPVVPIEKIAHSNGTAALQARQETAALRNFDPAYDRNGSRTVLTTPKRDFQSSPTNGRCKTGSVGPVRARSRQPYAFRTSAAQRPSSRPTRPTRPINAPRFRSRQLGNDSVDAVPTGCVPTGEEKLELLPRAEVDNHGIRNITRSSGVAVGQQFAVIARAPSCTDQSGHILLKCRPLA